MDFEELVGDWEGFESLVATLHETGNVTVERDVTLSGRSGAPRQIDVLIRHRRVSTSISSSSNVNIGQAMLSASMSMRLPRLSGRSAPTKA